MKKLFSLLNAVVLTTAFVYASDGNKDTYKVDTQKSKINWIGAKPAGEHNGTVDLSEGTLDFTNGKLSGGKFTIDLRTIVNFDLKSAEWNKKLVDHLKSEDFFYVEKYPFAKFEISKVEALSDTEYAVSGFLTMKEVTKTVNFNARVAADGDKLNATTDEFILDRTQWKVEAMSRSIFADLKDNYVDDEMRINVVLVATK